ncbi:MAG: TIGR00300 family protein [Clostridiaceae bacterium]|nr:TIGR00300 family protein [Clostridiaceae bacterium]
MKNNDAYSASVILKEAIMDRHVPDDFYSTTNHTTMILLDGNWIPVQDQRMDAMIVVKGNSAYCKKLRDIKKGELLVCGDTGVRILNQNEPDGAGIFGFMHNCVSSERRNELIIQELAENIVKNSKKITFVLGPVVVHTGGDEYIKELIREGYVSSILTGNAVAVHDIEKNLYGTSLGICAKSGRAVKMGYRNHMRAINQINKHGSIMEAVKAGALNSGIMYECVKNNIPFVLAGSLRDDGPLPDTISDMIKAQEAYSKHLMISDLVIVLGSMLHGIAAGNMLPAKVDMVCIDINPAVVTKLGDRGSSQVTGIVTDVGLFLKLLVKEIKEKQLRQII